MVKDLGGVVAQQGVDFVFPVSPVGIEEIREVLREPHDRNPFRPGGGLELGILWDREPICLVLPEKYWPVVSGAA